MEDAPDRVIAAMNDFLTRGGADATAEAADGE